MVCPMEKKEENAAARDFEDIMCMLSAS